MDNNILPRVIGCNDKQLLHEICEIGLKPCASCKGTGRIKWGRETDTILHDVNCPSCNRWLLIKILQMLEE